MSDTAKDRHVTCKFGISNIRGIMDVTDIDGVQQVELPLYSHESYKIRTTLNRKQNDNYGILHGDNISLYVGKYYQKKFRKQVLWDFGDGTKKEGYYAEHSYKKAGYYKITCTFFDINRKAWINDYSIYVIVKEVFPTMISFDKSFTKSTIKCSKIERIARLLALNSNTVKDDLKIKIERIFEEKHFEDEEKNYSSLDESLLKSKNPYWTLMENTKQYYYNTNEVYSENLRPTKVFTPKYDNIYGKFYYNEVTDDIDIILYQVIPYYHIDEELKTVPILDPNIKLSLDKETHKEVVIHQVYTEEQLPQDVSLVGKRAWVDVYYKCDYIGDDNTFSIFYDIEETNITGELDTSTNYLNIIPIGLNVNVIPNDISDVKIALSLDGFIRPQGNESIKSDFFIDQHLLNSLFSNMELDTFVFPYITYEKNNEFIVSDNMYYIPKDIIINCSVNFDSNESCLYDDIKRVFPWFVRVPFSLGSSLISNINVSVCSDFQTFDLSIPLVKQQLVDVENVIIPKEKQHKEDIDRLLKVYMNHPMWDEKNNVKEMFKLMLGNGYLDTIMTSVKNYIDNNQNIKTCYLSNLISMLQMMGEDVSLFESSQFDNNNDLKGFVRLLSMNHSELVGHLMNKTPDIQITNVERGQDVGEQIDIHSLISINDEHYIESIDGKELSDVYKGNIILRDNYTNETRIISFFDIQNREIMIKNYDVSWGWNLLLPNEFFTITEKINTLIEQRNNKAYSRAKIQENETEIERLSKIKADMINGYYSFYQMKQDALKERIGNFMDTEYITDRINDTEEWDAPWGVAHEILMKILIDNCKLKKTDNIGIRIGDEA